MRQWAINRTLAHVPKGYKKRAAPLLESFHQILGFMQQPENFIGTWYENHAAQEYDKSLWTRAWELKKEGAPSQNVQDAFDTAYDFTMKRFGKKCADCGHFHDVLWNTLCWQCVEKKYGQSPIWEPSYSIDGCVCCRDMKYTFQ